MHTVIRQEVERLITLISDLNEEFELASEDQATLRQIDEVKTQTSQIILKYNILLKGVVSEEKAEVIRGIGLKIAELEGKLSRLQEAPE
jgi:hypothetical protein